MHLAKRLLEHVAQEFGAGHVSSDLFWSIEMDIPIARRGKIVSAVRIPPISKILVFRILAGNPLISPLNCSNAAKSTITAATSIMMNTAPHSMDRMLNSRCRAVGSLTTMFLWCRSDFVTARTETRDTPNRQKQRGRQFEAAFCASPNKLGRHGD